MAKVRIEDHEYEMPDLGDMTMGQARILKRYTGLSLQQIATAEVSDPDLIAAFCHLALAAANPTLTFAQIEAQVSEIHLGKFITLEDEDDNRPPPSGPNATASELNGSGESSAITTDETPATTLRSTGTPA